jgi:site-specific DNA-methyltransferase (adenine-specific)
MKCPIITTNTILHGDSLELLKCIPDNSVEAIVTDPPYNIKADTWDEIGSNDAFQHWVEKWATESNRILKPGGHLLSFASPRLQHRVAMGIENAGFAIKDTLEWIYATGFPKSYNVSKGFDNQAHVTRPVIKKGTAGMGKMKNSKYGFKSDYAVTAAVTDLAKKWDGYGTSLKPAHESIILAQKPMDGGTLATLKKWGTGALNIGGSLIPYTDEKDLKRNTDGLQRFASAQGKQFAATRADMSTDTFTLKGNLDGNPGGRVPSNIMLSDPLLGDYDKFFLVPKPSVKEKTHDGLVKNIHRTVKPLRLMTHLVKLVTREGDTILDPFSGSGTTSVAASCSGRKFIGIDIDADNVGVANARVNAGCEVSKS